MKDQNDRTIFLEIFTLFQQKRFQEILIRATELKKNGDLTEDISRIAKKAEEFLMAERFVLERMSTAKAAITDGDFDLAHREIAKIEEIDNSSPDLVTLKSELENLERERFAALKKVETTTNPEELFEEALLFYYQNRWQHAAARFQEILDSNPDHLKAKRLLEECEKRLGSDTDDDQPQAEDSILGPIISEFAASLDGESEEVVELPAAIAPETVRDEPDTIPEGNVEEQSFPAFDFSGQDAVTGTTRTNGVQSLDLQSFGIRDPKTNHEALTPNNSHRLTTADEPQSINFFTIVLAVLGFFLLLFGSQALYQQMIIANRVKEAQIERLVTLGIQEISHENFEGAREFWQQIFELESDNVKAKALIDSSYLEEKSLKEKKIKQAQSSIEEAERYLLRNSFDKALNALDQAQAKDPESPFIIPLRKKILAAKEKSEAEKENRNILRQQEIRKNLQAAEYYLKKGEFELARDHCLKILRIEPENALTVELMKQIKERENQKGEGNEGQRF